MSACTWLMALVSKALALGKRVSYTEGIETRVVLLPNSAFYFMEQKNLCENGSLTTTENQ